jgi:hypothetical protein
MKKLIAGLILIVGMVSITVAQGTNNDTFPRRTFEPQTMAFLEGSGPPRHSLVAYWDGRPVGGGLTNDQGNYRIPIEVVEAPGDYLVEVRVRGTSQVITSTWCVVPHPEELQTIEAEAAATTASKEDTPRPTNTPRSTNTPTATPDDDNEQDDADETATDTPTNTPTSTASELPNPTTFSDHTLYDCGNDGGGCKVDPPYWPCEKGQIKGNKSKDIYHVPGGAFYDRTYENVECFDTIEEIPEKYRASQR